jgi:hypothetical protein
VRWSSSGLAQFLARGSQGFGSRIDGAGSTFKRWRRIKRFAQLAILFDETDVRVAQLVGNIFQTCRYLFAVRPLRFGYSGQKQYAQPVELIKSLLVPTSQRASPSYSPKIGRSRGSGRDFARAAWLVDRVKR